MAGFQNFGKQENKATITNENNEETYGKITERISALLTKDEKTRFIAAVGKGNSSRVIRGMIQDYLNMSR